MSKNEEVEEKVDTAVAELEEDDATEGGQAMSTILNAVKENPSLIEDPEIAKVIDMASGKKPEKAEAPKQTKTTEKTGEKQEPKAEIKEEPAKEQKSLFFKEEEQEEGEIDDVQDHIKEKYSIDDVNKFFTSVDKWRNDAQETRGYQTKMEDIENAFSEMPDTLFNAFNEWANGGDWEEALSNVNGLDYTASFDDYDKSEIVGYYFPDEFEKDDFEDYSDDATVKRAIGLAKSQFNAEKNAFEEQRAEYAERAEKTGKVLKESATSSVEKLKEVFPGFGKSEMKKVKDTLASGNLGGVFFNKDGSYTDDAAIKLALALYGRDELQKATSRTKKSQEVLKNTVAKGSEKPSVKSTQSQQTQVPEEVTGIFKDVFVKQYY